MIAYSSDMQIHDWIYMDRLGSLLHKMFVAWHLLKSIILFALINFQPWNLCYTVLSVTCKIITSGSLLVWELNLVIELRILFSQLRCASNYSIDVRTDNESQEADEASDGWKTLLHCYLWYNSFIVISRKKLPNLVGSKMQKI